jgi:hypothetical protein
VKVNVVCPHCDKKKYKIQFKEGEIEKIKGAKWNILMKQESPSTWTKDWGYGIAVGCKCGKTFFVYNLKENRENPIVQPNLRDGLLAPWFCKKCGQSFMDTSMTCPTCSTQY